jgi:hypothetical protein
MPLLNYTSGVAPMKTCAEITKMLVSAGAVGVAQRYDGQGHMIGMDFVINDHGDNQAFSLPVRIGAVRDTLVAQKVPRQYQTLDHAERVAWRILKAWIGAQLAIIETGMVTFDQVMLPYLRTDSGDTVYEKYEINQRSITSGSPG